MLFQTKPLPIIDAPADASHKYASGRISYEFIVLHHTGGVDSRGWLSTTSIPSVSAHRLIRRAGEIYKIVPDNEVAFTQGYSYMGGRGYFHSLNQRSLSIEFEHVVGQDYPKEQLYSGALQVVEWWGAYGFMALLYHLMIDPDKSDPEHFPRQQFDGLIRDILWSTSSHQSPSH